jgi:dihydroorotate dehydrogenase (fumarate)
MNLETRYLGLNLPTPFLVGSSPLVYELDTVLKLEEAGAGAIVMHSLYEEQILRRMNQGLPGLLEGSGEIHPESARFPLHPDAYLDHIRLLKKNLQIPLIASLNGLHPGKWLEYARKLEGAGADALELNVYFTPHAESQSSEAFEKQALRVVDSLCKRLSIPLAVKLSPVYAGLPAFLKQLAETGTRGAVLFNSFLQTDIDITSISYRPNNAIWENQDLLLRTRWIACLYGRTPLDLCLSGGVESVEDIVKGLLSGATSIQLVSALLEHGPSYLQTLKGGLAEWMNGSNFTSLNDMRGILSFERCGDPTEISRASYQSALQSRPGFQNHGSGI